MSDFFHDPIPLFSPGTYRLFIQNIRVDVVGLFSYRSNPLNFPYTAVSSVLSVHHRAAVLRQVVSISLPLSIFAGDLGLADCCVTQYNIIAK